MRSTAESELELRMQYSAKVFIMPKPAILDPQGKAVANSLHALGYDDVLDVRMGKLILVRVRAKDRSGAASRIEEMCRGLLANQVIEDFQFDLDEEESRAK